MKYALQVMEFYQSMLHNVIFSKLLLQLCSPGISIK